jgi:hypothetical protein
MGVDRRADGLGSDDGHQRTDKQAGETDLPRQGNSSRRADSSAAPLEIGAERTRGRPLRGAAPGRSGGNGLAHQIAHPTGQCSKKYPQVDGHVVRLSGRHAKLRRDGYRKPEHG